MASCGGNGGNNQFGDNDSSGSDCLDNLDPSRSLDTAFTADFGMELQDTFCPRRDDDYWRINTTAPGKIVQAEATFEKLSDIRLALEWFGPAGACVTTNGCSTPSECMSGEVCDTARGACRTSALVECAGGMGCPGGTMCSEVEAVVANVVEDGSATTFHRVAANFPALFQGPYAVRIFDIAEFEDDADVQYTLELTEIDEPDLNEPNDVPNLATVLTSGTPIDGYLATLGDTDYFEIAGLSEPMIVSVELTWDEGAQIVPTWSLSQDGGFALAGPAAIDEGTTFARRATRIVPEQGRVVIRVQNQAGVNTFDVDNNYTLTVRVFPDPTPSENPVRNDTPDTATPIALLAPGGAAVNIPNERLIAENDQDWFVLEQPATGDNTLLFMSALASVTDPATAGFILQATFYQVAAAGTCPPGSPTLMDGRCLNAWIQRPSPDCADGESQTLCDPQLGGPSPNDLQTQLPLFTDDDLYVQIRHLPSTAVLLDGFSETVTYNLSFEHKVEPDVVERTNPDNVFQARPIDKDLSDFFSPGSVRTITGHAISGGGSGNPFTDVLPGTGAVAAMCTAITLQGYDGDGAVAAPAGAIAGGAGEVFSDATCMTPAATAAGTLYVQPAAAGPVQFTVGTREVAVPGVATGADPFITVTGTSRVVSEGNETVVSVTLSAPAAVDTELTITPSGVANGTTVRCADAVFMDETVCTNVATMNTCTGTPTTGACNILIPAGQTTYDVLLGGSSADGNAGFVVTDPADALGGASYWVAVRPPQTLQPTAAGNYMEGYISYEGDYDFWQFNIASIPPGVGITLEVAQDTTPIDIRISALRGNDGTGFGFDQNPDLCQGSCSPGICSARNLCERPAVNECVGPATGLCTDMFPGAPAQTDDTRCVYTLNSSPTLDVIVSEKNANDWDENRPYRFKVYVTEGCSSACNAIVCAGNGS